MEGKVKGLVLFIAVFLIILATLLAEMFDHSQTGGVTLIIFIIALFVVGIPTALLISKYDKDTRINKGERK